MRKYKREISIGTTVRLVRVPTNAWDEGNGVVGQEYVVEAIALGSPEYCLSSDGKTVVWAESKDIVRSARSL